MRGWRQGFEAARLCAGMVTFFLSAGVMIFGMEDGKAAHMIGVSDKTWRLRSS